MNEKVSIIIPVYNVEQYLKRSLNSVLQQTYENLEIILVDDGSEDNSGKICDEYAKGDGRIRVFHKKNGGVSDARNAGIDLAQGEYVTFIDSDDWVDRNYIEELLATAEKNKADIVITSHKIHYPKRTIDLATREKSIIAPEEALKRILYSNNIDLSPWAKLYRKELFKYIRFPKGRLYEDAATTYRLIDKSKIVAINSVSTYNYRMNNNSISRCQFNPKKLDLITSTKEMTDFVSEKYPKLKRAANRRLKYAQLSTLTQLAKSSKKYPEYETEIMALIREGRGPVLVDKNTPIRDKAGLLMTYFGFSAFRTMWSTYERITSRK